MSSRFLAAASVGQLHADVFDAVAHVHLDAVDFELAGFDLREVEDVVDDPEQRRGARADGLRELALRRLQRRVEQQLRHADHAVHRRADLVTHVGEEVRLRPDGGRFRILGRNARFLGFVLLGDVLQSAGEAGDDAALHVGRAHDAHPQLAAALA